MAEFYFRHVTLSVLSLLASLNLVDSGSILAQRPHFTGRIMLRIVYGPVTGTGPNLVKIQLGLAKSGADRDSNSK